MRPRNQNRLLVGQLRRRTVLLINVLGGDTRIDPGNNPGEPMRFDLLAPAHNIVGIQSDAKHIGRNESQLCRVESNVANQDAVDPGYEPPLPTLLPEEDRGTDCQHTGNIV